MSPFGQFNFRRSITGGMESNFNPILHYIDELDRHFSNHHHLLNCFIPRFDLEEDSHFFYLHGEIPGAKAENITVVPLDSTTLEISGSVHRHNSSLGTPRAQEIQSDDNEHRSSLSSTDTSRNGKTEDSKLGSRKDHHQQENKLLLSERLVGSFHRTFTFPSPVDEDAITAILKDGLLTVQIPKKKGLNVVDKTRRITITEGK